MVWMIAAGVILCLLLLTCLVNVVAESTVTYTPAEKSARFILRLQKVVLIRFLFTLQKDDNGRYVVNYFKNDALIHTYLTGELIREIRRKRASQELDILKELDTFPYKEKVRLDTVNIRVDIGWDDAAVAAILCGLLTIAVNTLLGRLYDSNGMPKAASVKITPFFQKKLFNMRLEAVTSIKLVYVLLSRVKAMILNMKTKDKDEAAKEQVLRERREEKKAC